MMRPWRKIHQSVLESRRFAELSDGAACLFFLLVIGQDDVGWYPWERLKIRRLTVARQWTDADADRFATELVTVGMAEWAEGGLMLHRGADLNGRFRRDVTPLVYERGDEEALPPAIVEPDIAETPKTAKSSWTAPDWYRPMTDLAGYKKIDHSRHAASVEAACKEAGVSPADVVKIFAEDYPKIRFSYSWTDPSSALKGKPLMIAIKQASEATNGSITKRTDPRTGSEIPDGYERARIRRSA